jgi:hypothetical protein
MNYILNELSAIGLIIACVSGLTLFVISIFITIDKLPK